MFIEFYEQLNQIYLTEGQLNADAKKPTAFKNAIERNKDNNGELHLIHDNEDELKDLTWFDLSSAKDNEEIIMGIYIIKNKDTNQLYVGQSFNLYERLAQHAKAPRNDSPLLHAAIRDNIDKFEYAIIPEGRVNPELLYQEIKNKLNELEVHYIDYFKTFKKDDKYTADYNATAGGNGGSKFIAPPIVYYEIVKRLHQNISWQDIMNKVNEIFKNDFVVFGNSGEYLFKDKSDGGILKELNRYNTRKKYFELILIGAKEAKESLSEEELESWYVIKDKSKIRTLRPVNNTGVKQKEDANNKIVKYLEIPISSMSQNDLKDLIEKIRSNNYTLPAGYSWKEKTLYEFKTKLLGIPEDKNTSDTVHRFAINRYNSRPNHWLENNNNYYIFLAPN